MGIVLGKINIEGLKIKVKRTDGTITDGFTIVGNVQYVESSEYGNCLAVAANYPEPIEIGGVVKLVPLKRIFELNDDLKIHIKNICFIKWEQDVIDTFESNPELCKEFIMKVESDIIKLNDTFK